MTEIVAAVLVLLAATEPTSRPSEGPLFTDPFAGKLKDDWTWVREDPKAWRVDDSGLHVRAMKGTLWKTANNAHNVLLRPAPDGGDYALEVTVTSQPAAGGEQAGLIAYRDDDHYVKIVRESLEGRKWVVMGREIAAEGQMINRLPIDGESVRLRLVITRSGAAGLVKTADGQWKEVGHCDAAGEPATKVGLVAHGAPADADRWARFNDFQIARP
jgi:regulation of enolase protein 1 (concanavalin A-like superfamily)